MSREMAQQLQQVPVPGPISHSDSAELLCPKPIPTQHRAVLCHRGSAIEPCSSWLVQCGQWLILTSNAMDVKLVECFGP